MRKLSDVQSTLMRLRKKYRTALANENSNQEDLNRLKVSIHALEWVLEIQPMPTSVKTD